MVYLLEQVDQRPVNEVSEEELVTTGDRRSQVTESESRCMIFGISPAVSTSDHDSDHVQNKCNREVLVIHLSVNFWRRRTHYHLPFGTGCTKLGIESTGLGA